MSKTLLVVMSYAGNADVVKLNAPTWKIPGWDILGTCPENSTHEWPQGIRVLNIGKEGYNNPDLIRRWVSTIETLLGPKFYGYTDFCIIETDSMFLRKPPVHPGWLFTHLAGGKLNQGEKANAFYHVPQWFDRAAGAVIVAHGNKLIADQQWEIGSPDVFLGRIIEETNLPWKETNTFSVNSGMVHYMLPQALDYARGGGWYIHGPKLPEHINQILEASK